MKRIALAIALCASLAACTGQQVQSAGTIANQSVDLLYADAELLGQMMVVQGKITQPTYDQWDADARLAVQSVKLGTMTAQQLQVVLDQLKPAAPQ